jgi:predicted permease
MKFIKLMFSGQNRWRLLALPLLAIIVIVASGVFSDTTNLVLLLGTGMPIAIVLFVHNRRQERRTRFYR